MYKSKYLKRAKKIADWYEEKDIMFDDEQRPYVIVEYESDHSDEYRIEFTRRYLD